MKHPIFSKQQKFEQIILRKNKLMISLFTTNMVKKQLSVNVHTTGQPD